MLHNSSLGGGDDKPSSVGQLGPLHLQVVTDCRELFMYLMLSVLSFAFAYYILFRNDQDKPVCARA